MRQAETANERVKIRVAFYFSLTFIYFQKQMEGEINVIDSAAKIQIDQIAATASVEAATIRATQEAAGDGEIQKAIV